MIKKENLLSFIIQKYLKIIPDSLKEKISQEITGEKYQREENKKSIWRDKLIYPNDSSEKCIVEHLDKSYSIINPEIMSNSVYHGWKEFVDRENITSWAYIRDIE